MTGIKKKIFAFLKRELSQTRWGIILWVALAFILLVVVVEIPRYQADLLQPSSPKDHFEIENASRDNLLKIIQALGGLGFIFTAYFAWRNLQISERNLRVSEDKQVTDRFSKAVEMLSNDDIHIRLGGIYLLERISKDSAQDYQQIIEVLTAFIREKAKIGDGQANLNILSLEIDKVEKDEILSSPIDLEAALKVLCRRKGSFGKGEEYSLDLRETNLRKANLKGINLRKAILLKANFQSAFLEEANFQEANLLGVNLKSAFLNKANFQDAILFQAILYGAVLVEAKLQRASLHRTDFQEAVLDNANLQGAKLQGASFTYADLQEANLERADISQAHFEGAKFSNPQQVIQARNWKEAYYDEDFYKQLVELQRTNKE